MLLFWCWFLYRQEKDRASQCLSCPVLYYQQYVDSLPVTSWDLGIWMSRTQHAVSNSCHLSCSAAFLGSQPCLQGSLTSGNSCSSKAPETLLCDGSMPWVSLEPGGKSYPCAVWLIAANWFIHSWRRNTSWNLPHLLSHATHVKASCCEAPSPPAFCLWQQTISPYVVIFPG